MTMKANLDSVIKSIIKFRDERDWIQYHDPKNLAEAISIEAAELQELFLWLTTEQAKDLTDDKVQRVKEEIADIFIFMTYLCNHFEIDLLEAVENKVQENYVKYPIEKAKGSSKKYTEITGLNESNSSND